MEKKPAKQVAGKAPGERAIGARVVKSGGALVPALDITREKFLESTGVQSIGVATILTGQVSSAIDSHADEVSRIRVALDLLGEMAPRNATESMLAVQMIGVHSAAVEAIRRSLLPNQQSWAVDAETTRGVRLMRLFTEQLGAMAKLQGRAGQQKMTVEHVHVHAGGQAIVGPVAGGKDSGTTGSTK
jgi:hypothetical protein